MDVRAPDRCGIASRFCCDDGFNEKGCITIEIPMKKNVFSTTSLLVILLPVQIGEASCQRCKTPDEVRADSKDAPSMTDLFNQIDVEITRLETQVNSMQRKPTLKDEPVYNFDLEGAAATGPENARLTIVVFSEFECHLCRMTAEIGKELRNRYPQDIRLVFMNFPLNKECNSSVPGPLHKSSCQYARAAMAARDQGKFWEMHDYLFDNQRNVTVDSIAEFAAQQGMDAEAIKQAIETNKYAKEIEDQAKQLEPTGSWGIPTVFINGKMVQKARWDRPEFVTPLIDELLAGGKEEKPAVAATVQNPKTLPGARVVLADGTRLEDRLAKISLMPLAVNPPQ
jgi:protein-disulfide isomerase